MTALEKRLRAEETEQSEGEKKTNARCLARGRKMLKDLGANNAEALAAAKDQGPYISVVCPRRAGKTYMAAMLALITGEIKPYSLTLIISLNLKQLRRLYWTGGASGLHAINRKYKLNIEFHDSFIRWTHENGSIGYLLGTDDAEQLEVIRGMEADLYIVDECKSFVPGNLDTLVDDIIEPQRATRKGRLLLIGTPGSVPAGAFWRGTCPAAKDSQGRPYLVGIDENYKPLPRVDAWGRTPESDLLWSCHHWTLKDNTAVPHQWSEALRKKRAMGWGDDDPTWCREYLGHWAIGGDRGLVFRYSSLKGGGKVTWVPERTSGNPTGLPDEGAPWRLIGGLDYGYEDATALVLGGYSRRLGQLRVFWDHNQTHMLVSDLVALLHRVQDMFGSLDEIHADFGGGGSTLSNTLAQDYGFPIVRANKREKHDYLELVNDAMARGEVLIVENTPLESQLLTNAWKLPNDRPETIAEMARKGRLFEDDAIPNDSTDAFVYMFRGSGHRYASPQPRRAEPDPRSEAWNRQQLDDYRKQLKDERKWTNQAPMAFRRALTRPQFLLKPWRNT